MKWNSELNKNNRYLIDGDFKIHGNIASAWFDSLKFTVERSDKTLMTSAASGEEFV